MKTTILQLALLTLIMVVAALPASAEWTDDGHWVEKLDDETIVCDYGDYDDSNSNENYVKLCIVNDSELDLISYRVTPHMEVVPVGYDYDTGEFMWIAHVYHRLPWVNLPDTLQCEGKKYSMRTVKNNSFVGYNNIDAYGWQDAVIDGYAYLSSVFLPFKTMEQGAFNLQVDGVNDMHLTNVEVIEDGGLCLYGEPLHAEYVRIGNNIQKIGGNAFIGGHIVLDAEQPFQVADDAFEDCNLYVRNSVVERFKQQWPQYSNCIQGMLDVTTTPTSVTISPKVVTITAGVPDEDYAPVPECSEVGGVKFIELKRNLVNLNYLDVEGAYTNKYKYENLKPGTLYHFPVGIYSDDDYNRWFVDTITVRTPNDEMNLSVESWELANTSIKATFSLGCETSVEHAWVNVDGHDIATTATTTDGITRFTVHADNLEPNTFYDIVAHCVAEGKELSTSVSLPTLCVQSTNGDVSGDGKVDVEDVNKVINIILELE